MHILISSSSSNTSSLVSAIPSIPEIFKVCLTRTPSNQPHLLFRLVTVPNSFPLVPSNSPISSVSSVGKGPSPTLVVYAFATPITLSINVGPTPAPIHAPPDIGFDDVTKGYVP